MISESNRIDSHDLVILGEYYFPRLSRAVVVEPQGIAY